MGRGRRNGDGVVDDCLMGVKRLPKVEDDDGNR